MPAVAQAANENFLGTWKSTAGNWTILSQEPSGSCTGTSSFGYEMTNCHVSGTAYEFLLVSGGYKSQNHGTIVGNKATGEFTDNFGHEHVPYTAVRAGAEATVNGQVLNQKSEPAEGVKLSLTGMSDESNAVTKTTTTNAAGGYSFEVPDGTYEVKASGDPLKENGGELAVAAGKTGPSCSGTAKEATCTLKHLATGEEGSASFTYTQCGATARETNSKEPTGCPIIFIPGILGSRIFCSKGEIFFKLRPQVEFDEIHLNPDGETNPTNHGLCTETAHTPPGEEGLLTNVATEDVYGSIFKYLTSIGTNGVYAYPYDWRRSVPAAASGLSGLVEEVLKKSGAKHVVLVAHSMGGLVTQQYINTGTNAEKVSRAVTIGTPYWGAPKSMIPLLNGHANEFSLEKLDGMFGPTALQGAVRDYLGLFWLYPSAAYGPWLQVTGGAFTGATLGGAGIAPWVESLGGNPLLLALAESGHATLDTFKPKGVDYQIIVGTGLPTITGMKFTINDLEPEQLVSVTYGSGDATVPAVSQTQGAFPGTNSPVGIHYVCDVGHSAEPADPAIQAAIKEFTLNGGAIPQLSAPCLTFNGAEVVLYKTNVVGHGTAAAVKKSSGGTLTIEQAVAQGLVQVFEHGGQTILVTDAAQPVKLSVPAQNLTMRVRSLSNKGEGPALYYGPLNGSVTIAEASVSKAGKRLRAGRPAGTPHVTATVKRRGRSFLVTLRARSSRGLRAIYYMLGKSARHTYTRPLLLSARQLKSLRFAGVSLFGEWEPAQRARA